MSDIAQSSEFDLTDAASFAFWTTDKLRWGDTDGLGHINNVQFARFFESGRFDYLMRAIETAGLGNEDFVIAHLEIDFRAEMHYPGEVHIGSRLVKLGRSSIHFGHGLFQEGRCTATARAIVVHIDQGLRRSTPLPENLRTRLRALAAPPNE